MKTDGDTNSAAEQARLDRVVIAAAVAALFGPAARIRSVMPAEDRGCAWVRQGRLGVQNAHRMPPALARSGPAFERGRS